MLKEEWKEIPGFPGYELSNHGRMRKEIWTRANSGKAEKPIPVKLRRGGTLHAINVRRLVVTLFGNAPLDPKDVVICKDGNANNLSIVNLEVRKAREVVEKPAGKYEVVSPSGEKNKVERLRDAATLLGIEEHQASALFKMSQKIPEMMPRIE